MTTNTTTMTTAERLAEAEAKADELRAEARALQAQAEAEAQQAKRDEQTARLQYEEQRARDYATNYAKPLRELRAAFDNAVITGGNYTGAWIKYMAAVQAAAAEQRRLPRLRHAQAEDRHEAVAKQINEWQNELQARANRVTSDRPAFTADREPTGWWTDTIHALIGQDQPRNNETRVQQINRRLNALATALGKDVRRELDSTDWIHVLYYTEKPSLPMSDSTGHAGIESRTFAEAFQQALDKGIEAEAQHLADQRAEDFEAFRSRK